MAACRPRWASEAEAARPHPGEAAGGAVRPANRLREEAEAAVVVPPPRREASVEAALQVPHRLEAGAGEASQKKPPARPPWEGGEGAARNFRQGEAAEPQGPGLGSPRTGLRGRKPPSPEARVPGPGFPGTQSS